MLWIFQKMEKVNDVNRKPSSWSIRKSYRKRKLRNHTLWGKPCLKAGVMCKTKINHWVDSLLHWCWPAFVLHHGAKLVPIMACRKGCKCWQKSNGILGQLSAPFFSYPVRVPAVLRVAFKPTSTFFSGWDFLNLWYLKKCFASGK